MLYGNAQMLHGELPRTTFERQSVYGGILKNSFLFRQSVLRRRRFIFPQLLHLYTTQKENVLLFCLSLICYPCNYDSTLVK